MPDSLDDYVDEEWEREIDEVEDAYWEEEAQKDFEQDFLLSLIYMKAKRDKLL